MTRILIVDDEPDITLSFKMILEGNGFKVDTYNDPVIAKGNFKPDAYDLEPQAAGRRLMEVAIESPRPLLFGYAEVR